MGKTDEVARDQFGALMDELVERVLTICARLSPDDRAGLIIDLLPCRSTCFPSLSISSC